MQIKLLLLIPITELSIEMNAALYICYFWQLLTGQMLPLIKLKSAKSHPNLRPYVTQF